MKIHCLISFALLSILAACGDDATPAADSLAGHWVEETGTEARGMTLEFDAASDKMMVHTAPEPDGSHAHLGGTYTFDAVAKAVTVNCALAGKGKGDVWRGAVDGEQLTVTSGEVKLSFRKGDSPHGHK